VKTARDTDLSQRAGFDVINRFLEEFRGAALDADLDNALGFRSDLDHAAAFGDGERERFLDVDILAGTAGVDEHQGVPMIGAGDGDGFDVFVFEEFAVVFVAGWRGAGFGGGEVEVIVAEIADGDGAGVAVFQETFVNLVAAVAEADEAHLEAAVGAEYAGIAEGGGGGRGFCELAAGHVMFL
jgi:hypothetical protein